MVEMTILISTLAITFTAFCVWLMVRIVNRRERWAKWTAVAVGVPALYIASFGPACWATRCPPNNYQRIAPGVYWPIGDFYSSGKRPLVNAVISWYARLYGDEGLLVVPTDKSGKFVIDL